MFPIRFEWLKWKCRREFKNKWTTIKLWWSGTRSVLDLPARACPGARGVLGVAPTRTPPVHVPAPPCRSVSLLLLSSGSPLLCFLSHYLSPFAWLASLDPSHLFKLRFLWIPCLIFLTRSTLCYRHSLSKHFRLPLYVSSCGFLDQHTVSAVVVETCSP